MRRGKLRSVLPLPKYTLRKPLAGGKWAYYWNPPLWATNPKEGDDRGPCSVGRELLGSDYEAAVKRVERVLIPLFESWRTRGVVDLVAAKGTRQGTLDWLFHIYRSDAKFKNLRAKVKRIYNQGLDLVGNYLLKDGSRFGEAALPEIDANGVDKLYEALLPQAGGGERRTSVNNAMKYCRRAWNVAQRLHPKDIPAANPFAGMGLVSKSREVAAATYGDLLVAVAQADAMGLPSLGTALMVTWEWLQREEHIFTALKLEHYRPKNRPNEVYIVHPKNNEEIWIPLYDKSGAALFPELMARMDRMRANRVGSGLFFVRDWIDRRAGVPLPWATARGQIDLVGAKLRPVLDAADIDPSISFTSFRHGGLTEMGDAELTDAQARAISRHRNTKTLAKYIKRTEKQIVDATLKRRASRPAAKADDGQMDLFGVKGGGK